MRFTVAITLLAAAVSIFTASSAAPSGRKDMSTQVHDRFCTPPTQQSSDIPRNTTTVNYIQQLKEYEALLQLLERISIIANRVDPVRPAPANDSETQSQGTSPPHAAQFVNSEPIGGVDDEFNVTLPRPLSAPSVVSLLRSVALLKDADDK